MVGGAGCGKTHGVGGGGVGLVVVVDAVAAWIVGAIADAGWVHLRSRQSRWLLLRVLHDRCAGASGDVGSRGLMWSAVNGSSSRLPSPQMWQ